MIEFFIACVPPTANHQRKKIVRVGNWTRLADSDDLVKAKDMIDGLLVPHRPLVPLEGPLTLTLEFTWPWNKGETKRNRARRLMPRDVNPDCSNLAKTTEDRLAALRFIKNDSQVVELVVRKFRGDHPGIGVRIESCLDPVQTVLPPMAERPTREESLFA